MIVKMKFISITGPKDKIDVITDEYLSKYEIQLENALSELKTVNNLLPFEEANPYHDRQTAVNALIKNIDTKNVQPAEPLSDEEMDDVIQSGCEVNTKFQSETAALQKEVTRLTSLMKQIDPFRPLDFDIHDLLKYSYIKFRFGRISNEHYHTLQEYMKSHEDVLYIEGVKDDMYVYYLYFTSIRDSERLDAVLKSLHFERIFIPDEFNGTPETAYQEMEKKRDGLQKQIRALQTSLQEELLNRAPKLLAAQTMINRLAQNFDVRRLAACIHGKQEDFFILCGWIAKKDVKHFLHDIRDNPDIIVVIDDEREDYFGDPPTKLENPKIFRPFELFVRMYGYPAQDELDPTIFIAITYTFIFGFMFGDVGQGLSLFVLGLLLYKKKKSDLGGIIAAAGVFSAFFGYMFGSFFGFEFTPRWLRPMDSMTKLPFVGSLNTVFIVAIAFGMGMIILTMIFHIALGIKSHNVGESIFDANGLAGLVFYSAIVVTIVLYMTGHTITGSAVLIVMFVIPLILVAMKEPLTNIVRKRQKKLEESVGMFAIQTFFELFETLLAYFSNTISFVRIGAFAVSHGAMMGVVLMLSGAEKGNINWFGIVLGNLIVCGLEGLIVGIQVLRLEYYEMFSRFYKGSGRMFKPFGRQNNG